MDHVNLMIFLVLVSIIFFFTMVSVWFESWQGYRRTPRIQRVKVSIMLILIISFISIMSYHLLYPCTKHQILQGCYMVGGLLGLLTFEIYECKQFTNKSYSLKAFVISQCIGVGLIIVFTCFFCFVAANGHPHNTGAEPIMRP